MIHGVGSPSTRGLFRSGPIPDKLPLLAVVVTSFSGGRGCLTRMLAIGINFRKTIITLENYHLHEVVSKAVYSSICLLLDLLRWEAYLFVACLPPQNDYFLLRGL